MLSLVCQARVDTYHPSEVVRKGMTGGEFQAIAKELCEKNELIKKHSCRIEQLEQEIHVKNKQCKELLRRLKRVTTRSSCQSGEEEYDEDDFDECDVTAMDKSLNGCITDLENQTHLLVQKSQDAELQMQMMTSERKKLIIERNEMGNKLQCAMNENERLTKELARLKTCLAEKEDFNKMTEQLKQEKCELIKKVNGLQENIKEINNNFKESRWALASEVAEKHDQVHEAQRRIVELEEQLRHADQQIQFKEDIVRELRKELRSTRKSMCNLDKPQKPTVREHSPPTQLIGPKSLNVSGPDKTINDDDLKFDIHIYSLTDNVRCKQSVKKTEKGPELRSVDVQTEVFGSTSPTPLKVRNVSTQHRTRVQKLPRSFGTLTVTPWSGTTGQIASDDICIEYIQENKKNQKGVFTVPFSST
ncbi:hypothetical protein RUM43_009140 [Polyplax serrata]|uniref:Uncharacterized protein n=1 Tax=Polyplax serrata TaxID=468196 RepID=A0AAN8PHS4_POLSC